MIQNYGSPLLSVGQRLRKTRNDTSGNGERLERLSIWRPQDPTPSAILNEAGLTFRQLSTQFFELAVVEAIRNICESLSSVDHCAFHEVLAEGCPP
jgi:hypothetical protein